MSLFAGTAEYYARYRLPYPLDLFALLRQTGRLDVGSWVLDLGTGTGQIAVPLARAGATVVAVDQSVEMVTVGQRQVAGQGLPLHWLVAAAEALPLATAPAFQLVTIGQAFHWFAREQVLDQVWSLLAPGGWVALVGGSTFWGAPEPWAQVVTATVQHWLGTERRAGSGLHQATAAHGHRPFAEYLLAAGFTVLPPVEFVYDHQWRIDAIIGCLYSTSYCRVAWLGEQRADFEDDLRQRLGALGPAEGLTQRVRADCLLAQKPATAP